MSWFDGLSVSLKLLCLPPSSIYFPMHPTSYFVHTYVASDNHVMIYNVVTIRRGGYYKKGWLVGNTKWAQKSNLQQPSCSSSIGLLSMASEYIRTVIVPDLGGNSVKNFVHKHLGPLQDSNPKPSYHSEQDSFKLRSKGRHRQFIHQESHFVNCAAKGRHRQFIHHESHFVNSCTKQGIN
jgi:hypothetical protein